MVIGFPKSGTTTIARSLEASGLRAAHWKERPGPGGRFIGALIYDAVYKGLDPFAHLAGFDAVAQADVCWPIKGINFWPNLDFTVLRAIRRAHPECIFLLNYRDPEAICDSICTWKDMQTRLEVSEVPGLPRGYGGERQHLITWIENHFDACRTYFAADDHFLEIDIADLKAPTILSQALGVELKEWGVFKPSEERQQKWSRNA